MFSAPLFADRILNIAITGPLVRLELGTLQAPKTKGQAPGLLPTQTLIMPLDGFVASMGMLDGVMKQLHAAGVFKSNPPAEAVPGNVQ